VYLAKEFFHKFVHENGDYPGNVGFNPVIPKFNYITNNTAINKTSIARVAAPLTATILPPSFGPNSDTCSGNECFTNRVENDITAIPGLLFCFHPSCLKLYRRSYLIFLVM